MRFKSHWQTELIKIDLTFADYMIFPRFMSLVEIFINRMIYNLAIARPRIYEYKLQIFTEKKFENEMLI